MLRKPRPFLANCLSRLACFSSPPPLPRQPRSTLFPYTTLFRSLVSRRKESGLHRRVDERRRIDGRRRSEEHTSELQSRFDVVCRLLLEKKKAALPCREALQDRQYERGRLAGAGLRGADEIAARQ